MLPSYFFSYWSPFHPISTKRPLQALRGENLELKQERTVPGPMWVRQHEGERWTPLDWIFWKIMILNYIYVMFFLDKVHVC